MDGTVLKTKALAGNGPERERERETESPARPRGVEGKEREAEGKEAEDGERKAGDAGAAAAGTESREFAMQFTSSPRGARLARRLAVRRLAEWGHPPASDPSCTVALLVGELTANAVRHGRVPGRDFRLRLAWDAAAELIRIEVSDAGPQWHGAAGSMAPAPGPDDESGRGLLLVDALAARWGVMPRAVVGKTVWAEVLTESGPLTLPPTPAPLQATAAPTHRPAPARAPSTASTPSPPSMP